ncbi:MAG: NifU family protein [Gemmatimonadota bacterium]|nr:NifU family protein [Gemmatimonadota bacterium]
MLTFTDRARDAVLAFMGEGDSLEVLRVHMTGEAAEPRFELTLVGRDEVAQQDRTFDMGGFQVVVDAASVDALEGAEVDYVERVNEAGFEVRPAPRAGSGPSATGPVADRVRAMLDERINPAVAAHGGAIELVGVDGTDVYIEMTGGCQGCAMSRMTLRQGVERMLREEIPEITAVHDATDHSSGANPYFSHPV